jgi:predicted dehydrogenase
MSDRIGVAVIGASTRCGLIMGYLKENPSEGFIAGVYDHISARSKLVIDKFQAKDAIIYASLEEAISDERVQAVFVGTPDNAHVQPVIAGMRANKHVYCEKPMATTVEDCDDMIDAAKASSGIFYLGMNLRHAPVYEKLYNVFASGELGKLLTVEASEYYSEGRTYFRRWNRLRKFGGGLWLTKACHDFDILNWFADARPTRVFAVSHLSHYKPKPDAGKSCRQCDIKEQCQDRYDIKYINAPKDLMELWDQLAKITEDETGVPRDICLYNSDKDTFDNGMATVEYENGILANYTLNVVSARNTRLLRLMGTKGSAEGDLGAGIVTVWNRFKTESEKRVYDLNEFAGSDHNGADNKIMAQFFNSCRTRKKPLTSWAEGRRSIQLALAARASCDSGQPVLL